MVIFLKIQDWQECTLRLIEKMPNKYNHTLKDELFKLTIQVVKAADMANQIKVNSTATRQRRLQLQNSILAYLTTSDRLMQLAVKCQVVSPRQLSNWSKNSLEVRNYLLAWIKSDHQRYAKKF